MTMELEPLRQEVLVVHQHHNNLLELVFTRSKPIGGGVKKRQQRRVWEHATVEHCLEHASSQNGEGREFSGLSKKKWIDPYLAPESSWNVIDAFCQFGEDDFDIDKVSDVLEGFVYDVYLKNSKYKTVKELRCDFSGLDLQADKTSKGSHPLTTERKMSRPLMSTTSIYHTTMPDISTALSLDSSTPLVDFVSTDSPEPPDSNSTQMDEAMILDILRDKNLKIFEPTVAYIIILMLLGVPGNSLVLVIYSNKWRRSTNGVFIMCLAVLDLCFCLFVHPMELVVIHNPYAFDFPAICKLFRFSSYTMSSTSGLVLVSIAADRFHRICRPLKKHLTPRSAMIACIGCLCIALFFAWPSLVIYGIDRKVKITTMGNVTTATCLFNNVYKYTPYPKIFFVALFLATLAIFVVLCILYGIVGISIYRQGMKWTNRGSSRSWSSRSNTETNSSNETSVFVEDGDGQQSIGSSNIPMSSIVKVVRQRARVRLVQTKTSPVTFQSGNTRVRQAKTGAA
ncbi:hypothetical protein ScPMuIL_013869 [Solemya velum]